MNSARDASILWVLVSRARKGHKYSASFFPVLCESPSSVQEPTTFVFVVPVQCNPVQWPAHVLL